MGRKNVVIISLNLIGFIALGVVYFNFSISKNNKKFGYVELETLRNEFVLSKQLDTEVKKVFNKRKEILDSLRIEIQMFEKKAQLSNMVNNEDIREYKLKRLFYEEKEKEFYESNTELENKYQEEIWNKLNAYIKEFGKDGGYEYIFGLNGSGAVMYARDENNLTKEILNYSNKKYNDK